MQISHRRHALRLAGATTLLGLAALTASHPARADAAWPTRPITFVVPGAPAAH
ncbi:tripartite tricarboxylate transporter substrate binding protein, partial [Diaphorobacter sp. DS2]